MTNASWPMSQHIQPGEVGGFLNFYAQEFEMYVDNRSALTSGDASTGTSKPPPGAKGPTRTKGGLHNITLPYVNSVSSETSNWSTNNSNDMLNRTDADTGLSDMFGDLWRDFYDHVDFGYRVQTLNMEVSNAGYKGPVLRQRHYSYSLINRSGSPGEGKAIAEICRSFQASVYPKMAPWRVADNIVMPPPMWTISYVPGPGALPNPSFDRRVEPYDSAPYWRWGGFTKAFVTGNAFYWGTRHRGENPNHPSISNAGHNKWRWNMDPFTSVLVNVSISPTSATDAIQVPVGGDWPLVTVLKLSFLEVDQALANQKWDAIVPYSWAQDEDNKFFGGSDGAASAL